jgi:hypothetical protein
LEQEEVNLFWNLYKPLRRIDISDTISGPTGGFELAKTEDVYTTW